jgi:hypothetical protein
MRMRSALYAAACCPLISCTPALAADATRQMITVNELRSAGSPDGIVDNRWFMPTENSGPAKHDFVGALALQEIEMSTEPAQLSSRKVLGKDPKIFPGAKLAFFTVDGDLVPVSQDVIRFGSTKVGRSFWDVIVQPGRVWSEPADGGWSRASFPFALVHSIEGETHNGLATFLYNATEVSPVRFQIIQQTSPYFVVDFFTAWGQVPAFYEPGKIENLDTLRAAYAVEQANRYPIRSWDDLTTEVGADKLRGFESAMDQREVLVSGLVYGDTLYLTQCKSAAGPMPYCDRIRFGVWSITKSAAAAVALLRLAQKYGSEVYEARIGDLVESSAPHGRWMEVTLGDAVNMATGVGFGWTNRESNIETGYLEGNYADWYSASSENSKLVEVFKAPDFPWAPGEVARYRDQDIFLLGVAMDRYLKLKEGPEANIWSMLVDEVYRPIGISHAPINRTIEAENVLGQPLMAYGFYATLGDLARIAKLYHDRGEYNGVQILHRGKVSELLYGTQERGLKTGYMNGYGETKYFHSFWSVRFNSEEGCRLFVPEMHGWGGNIVSLMPGGLTGLRLAKNWEFTYSIFDTTGMIAVGDRLARFCN